MWRMEGLFFGWVRNKCEGFWSYDLVYTGSAAEDPAGMNSCDHAANVIHLESYDSTNELFD